MFISSSVRKKVTIHPSNELLLLLFVTLQGFTTSRTRIAPLDDVGHAGRERRHGSGFGEGEGERAVAERCVAERPHVHAVATEG